MSDAKQLYEKYMITSMVPAFVPIVVEEAHGCTYVAADGKEFLDCFSGIAVTNAGNGHPKVIEAAKKQIDKLVHCCTYVYYNPRAAELCKVLADITPGRLQKSFLSNSGAEAIEGALRLAKQHTGRKEVVALTHSFHGRSYATLSITGNWARKKGGGPYMPGVSFAMGPDPYRCQFGTTNDEDCAQAYAENLRYTLKYHTYGDVAAFIAEPVQGEGGILVPPANYFKYVKQILDEQGILFICDEVQSGFGRTGKLFAIEHFGVEPDIMTMAKGIADGFPLSAFIAREPVSEAFKPGDHLSTFGGSPVSCAAAMANIAVLKDEKLVENSAKRGEQIMGRLRKFAASCKLVGDVRGKGLMIGIELVTDPKTKTPAAEQTAAVRKALREKHSVLVGAGGSWNNVIRLQPPLCLTEAEADRVCTAMEKVVAEVAKSI
ncbi:MAG: 5-aminovalerate aminotransferase DavT [Phycisphaerae bacterium]|nr:5-aminovalerate aminotransferase DavT [Phycisphaerae bacterium]